MSDPCPEQPDWDHWRKCDLWTLEEGLCLLVKLNPEHAKYVHDRAERVRDRFRRALNEHSVIAQEYTEAAYDDYVVDVSDKLNQYVRLARTSISTGELEPHEQPSSIRMGDLKRGDSFNVTDFEPLAIFTWAEKKGLPMPPELREMLADLSERQREADTAEELRARVSRLEAENTKLKEKVRLHGRHHWKNHIKILEAGIYTLVYYRDECKRGGKITGVSIAQTIDDHRDYLGLSEEVEGFSLDSITKRMRAALSKKSS